MSRFGGRVRFAVRVGAVVAATLALSPAGAVFADSAGPTDYVTTITDMSVDVSDAVRFNVEGSDAFVRATVTPGHELTVLGYDGEHYIRIDGDGAVFENHNSETYYYNQERFGGEVPPEADSASEPDWVRVDDDGEYAWHDHRAHWMAAQPLVGMSPGDSFPPETIVVVVDGTPVTITVVTTLQRQASIWWPAIGFAIAGLVIIGIAVGRSLQPWTIGLITASVATIFGAAEFLALPLSTGPSWVWWGLPAAAACTFGAGGWIRSSSHRAALALVAAGGGELLVWSWSRSGGLLAAYRPTLLPVGLDRAATVAVGVIAVALIVVSALAALPRSQPSAS